MIVTKNWLNEFVNLDGISTGEICAKLNEIGLEVDALKETNLPKNIVIGFVKSCENHPNSDHLHVCSVDVGDKELQIVCGAPNVKTGQFVACALVGAVMPNGMEIKPAKLRGVESFGMLCSSSELGLPKTNDGIMVLDSSVGELTLGRELCEMAFFKDAVVEIGLTPNRGDCLGVRGVARDLAVAFGRVLCEPKCPNAFDANSGFTLKNNTDAIVGVFKTHVPEGLNLKTALRLATAEMLESNTAKSLINYASHESNVALTGVNLSQNLEIRTLTNGGRGIFAGEALKGVCGICGEDFAPLFGEEILVVASYVSPDKIARTLGTDKQQKKDSVSYRASRGSEPDICCGMRALLFAFGGGNVVAKPEKAPEIREVKFDFSEISDKIGESVSREKFSHILESLGFTLTFDGSFVTAKIPPFRTDVVNSADVAEEIVRFVGIDNIASRPLLVSEQNRENATFVKYKNALNLRQKAAAEGFFECVHYAFDNEADLKEMGFSKCEVEILNPINAELGELRPTLLNHLLRSAEKNLKNQKKSVRLFEYGEVFDTKGEQKTRLSFVVSGVKNEASLVAGTKSSEWSLFEFAASVQNVIGKFELKNGYEAEFLSPFERAQIYQNGVCVGFLGRVELSFANKRDLPKTYVCEVNFDLLDFGRKQAVAYSKFPSVSRDLSVVVGEDVSFEEVKKLVPKVETLTKFSLVDIYKFENKKSLTLRFEFASFVATLTDEEVNVAMGEILASLQKGGATLR